jgi:hypothetical protein
MNISVNSGETDLKKFQKQNIYTLRAAATSLKLAI